jgi:hypothetical protein
MGGRVEIVRGEPPATDRMRSQSAWLKRRLERSTRSNSQTAWRKSLRAAVLVGLLVPLEVAAGQRFVRALSLVPYRHMRFDRFVVDHPEG